MKSLLASAAAISLLLQPVSVALARSGARSEPESPAWGVDRDSISTTVRPGDDFYRYVNEAWLKTATPPDGVPYIDASVEVYLATEQRVAELIAMARESTDAPGSPEQMIGDFHRSHADMERRNALGITPIASTLAIIGGTGSFATAIAGRDPHRAYEAMRSHLQSVSARLFGEV